MPTVSISVPVTMTSPQPPTIVRCEGCTVMEALRDLVARRPDFREQVFFKDAVNVCVALNGSQLDPPAVRNTEVRDGDELRLIMRVGGG